MKFWKRRKPYNEAYLEYDGDKVVQKEKKRRIEIGEEDTEDNYDAYPTNEDLTGEMNDNIEIEPEEERDRPKNKWLRLGIIVFWLAFIASVLYLFIPIIKETFNEPLGYSFVTPREEEEDEPVDIVEEPANDIPDNTVVEVPTIPTESDVPSSSENIEVDTPAIEEPIEDVEEGTSNSVGIAYDEARLYSNIHSYIVESAQKLRDDTQKYVSRSGHHVLVASTGNRIRTNVVQARLTLDVLDSSHPINNILTKRLDNLEGIALRTQKFTRETAVDELNEYLTVENEDSQQFINELIELLEEEGRTYEMLDGRLVFE